jgi:hypothetical protein
MQETAQRVARFSPILFPLAALSGCVVATEKDSAESRSTLAQASELQLPDTAVVGVAQRVVGGRVVETKVLNSLPAGVELNAALEKGADAQGFTYNEVDGAYTEDGISEVRLKYVERVPVWQRDNRATKPAGPLAPPKPPRPKLDPALSSMLSTERPDKLVEVYIAIARRYETSLRGASSALEAASLADAERMAAKRRGLIGARKDEAARVQAPILERLKELGAVEVGGGWLGVPGVSATLPLGAIPALAEHPQIARVELEFEGKPTHVWDGADMASSSGLHIGIYDDNGYHGQAYEDNPGGRKMRIGIIDREGFLQTHRGFLDGPNSPTRIVDDYHCTSTSCTSGAQGPQNDKPWHGTFCAAIAAGDITQNQISGLTGQQQLERSGVTRESDIYLFSIDNNSSVREAIEKAAELGVDVVSESYAAGGSATPCDGFITGSIQYAIYDAQFLGTIVVAAAGNDGGSPCNMYGIGEAPSAFTVGSAQDGSAATWSSRDRESYSQPGGATAVIDGSTRSGALSLVSALAPGCIQYSFSHEDDSTIVSGGCGTSYATPQIAGAAILVKDWFLDSGYTTILNEGRLFAVLLGMTDRADGVSTYRTSSFNPSWGGGRFQARMLTSDMGAPAGWESWSGIVSDGQVSDHNMLGSGAEPAGIGQFKVTAVFFEDDFDNDADAGLADIDLYVRSDNCAGVGLTGDTSYDVKLMARLGSSASGQALCIRREGFHVPTGESRRLHQFAYYSGGTSMR